MFFPQLHFDFTKQSLEWLLRPSINPPAHPPMLEHIFAFDVKIFIQLFKQIVTTIMLKEVFCCVDYV
jgi:hypothetical protein